MLYVKCYSLRKYENSFYFDPPTNISLGGGNLTPDPYETKLLKVGKSQEPNSGDHGLRTPNEGTNLRYLKKWADVADKICCRHT